MECLDHKIAIALEDVVDCDLFARPPRADVSMDELSVEALAGPSSGRIVRSG